VEKFFEEEVLVQAAFSFSVTGCAGVTDYFVPY